MSTKTTRGKAAKTAEAEPAAAAAEETPAQGTPADLAPLEPPTAEPTPEETPDETPADETPADEPQPGADEDGFGGDAPEPAAEPEPEPDPEPELPTAPPLADPRSVALDAPVPAPADEDVVEESPAITVAEHATKKLENDIYAEVTDKHGNLVDPDEAFTEANASGQVQCRIRLFGNTYAGRPERPVRTLLLAQGAYVTDMAAERIKTKLRQVAESVAAQRADQD